MIISKQRRSKKKEGEDDEYMFHKGSYWWFRRTQYIPRFGGVLQECGDFTWRVSDCEELVGVQSQRNDGGCFRGVIVLSISHSPTFF